MVNLLSEPPPPVTVAPVGEVLRRSTSHSISRCAFSLAPVVFAGVAALVMSWWVFPYGSVNHDEVAYLLQAEALREGRLVLDAPADAEAFTPWLATLRDGEFVFKYTPVHAGVLALGRTLLGSYEASLALIAAGCVAAFRFMAAELFHSRRSSDLATWGFALSPLVLVQSGTYLSYLSALLFLMLFIGAYLRTLRSSSFGWWVTGGAALGVAAAARPYDALLVALPFGLHALWSLRRGAVRLGQLIAAAVGAGPPLGLVLVANAAMTGNPLVLPFSLLDPLDRIGFGRRRLHPTNDSLWYGPVEAVQAFGLHAFWFVVFVFGGPVLIWLCFRSRLPAQPVGVRLVAAVGLSIPLGYLLFWGPYNVAVAWAARPLPYLGPFYWLPVVVPAVVLGVHGLSRLRQARPGLAVALVVVMVCIDVGAVGHASTGSLAYTEQAQILRAGLGAPDEAETRIVFVPQVYGPYLMHPFPFLVNRPDHDGPVLYALDRGRENFDVLASRPERRPYRLVVDGEITDDPDSRATLELHPISNVAAPAFDVRVKMRNPTSRPHVMVQVLHRGREDRLILDHDSTSGEVYEVQFRLSADDLQPVTAGLEHERRLRPDRRGLPLTISAIFSPDQTWRSRTITEWLVWDRITPDGSVELHAPFDARTMRAWPNGRWIAARDTDVIDVSLRTVGDTTVGPWFPAGQPPTG